MNYTLLQQRFDDANTTDEAFLSVYNAENIEQWHKVEMTVALNHLLKTGVWEKLDTATQNDMYPDELRQKIRKFLTTLASNIPELTVKDGEPETNIPILVSLGIVTEEDATAFLNLARDMVSQSFMDHGRETTQLDLSVMRNQAAIEATQQVISNAETKDSELTEGEKSRQSARANELAALRLVLSELEAGEERETPSAPDGEAWE